MRGVTRTIPRLFRRAVEGAADRTWLLADHREWTFGRALEHVERGASALRDRGIGTGDRVLVTARNTPDYVFTWLALMEVGAVQVPLNPESTDTELKGFIDQVDPAFVVDDGNVAALFEAPSDGRGPVDVDETDVAVMIPTSGTTGRSKLVMQTHLAYVMAGEGFPFWLGLTEDDRLMTSLPMFHLNAPAYSTLGSVAAHASLVLLPGFSATTFLDHARYYGVTQFNAIGAMVEILMRQPPRPDDADNPVRICYTGPSPSRQRQLEIEARFGWEVICGYALSETPYGLVWQRGTRPYGTLGSPRQHPELGHVNDARVIDDDGVEVGPRAEGELQLRNPAIMRGYYQMPEETAAVIVDGWLHTGDLVHVNEDGTYTFLSRKKEVIRRRGENLSPAEVEEALERHPDVVEAAVVAVPSELSEDEVKAFVVGAGDTPVDVADLHAFAAEHLAPYKVPRFIEVVPDLPHTATGRIAKHQLPRDRTDAETDMEPGPT